MFLADPEQEMVGVLMSQILLYSPLGIRGDFRTLTYEAIIDR